MQCLSRNRAVVDEATKRDYPRRSLWCRVTLSLAMVTAGLCASSEYPAMAAGNAWPRVPVNGFSTPTGAGFWLVYANGSVTATGDARLRGDASSLALRGPVVGGAVAPGGGGYWLVATDGGIFSYGSARFRGSMGNARLNQPVFSMAPSKSGNGYWLVARDGGIFSFGDARFYGSTGAIRLFQPIIGITTSVTGRGYRMVASDGGIFSFGDAQFFGSLPGRGVVVTDVVGTSATPTNRGYWVARSGGQIYAFGDAKNYGNFNGAPCDPIAAIFSNPKTQGYRLVTQSGATVAFGSAPGGSKATGTIRACPPAPPRTFGDGTYRVGVDLPAGTYRTRSNSSGCYWERLSGFGGSINEILANDFTDVNAVVTVSASDKGFRSSGCLSWTNDLSRVTASTVAPFGGGTYIVGTDIAAGTWRSSGGSSCYWERVSGFSGEFGQIIANDFTNAIVIVTVKSTDKGFHAAKQCGTWTKIG